MIFRFVHEYPVSRFRRASNWKIIFGAFQPLEMYSIVLSVTVLAIGVSFVLGEMMMQIRNYDFSAKVINNNGNAMPMNGTCLNIQLVWLSPNSSGKYDNVKFRMSADVPHDRDKTVYELSLADQLPVDFSDFNSAAAYEADIPLAIRKQIASFIQNSLSAADIPSIFETPGIPIFSGPSSIPSSDYYTGLPLRDQRKRHFNQPWQQTDQSGVSNRNCRMKRSANNADNTRPQEMPPMNGFQHPVVEHTLPVRTDQSSPNTMVDNNAGILL